MNNYSNYFDNLENLTKEYNLSKNQINQIKIFLENLLKWNKVYNLISDKQTNNLEYLINNHLLDCLAIIPSLENHLKINFLNKNLENLRLLDVGSGGGFPSVILAIYFPEINVFAIDKVNKKTAFLKQIKILLKLNNFEVLTQRVEELNLKFNNNFDIISCRAFSSLKNFTNLTFNLLKNEGFWLAMKSNNIEEELKRIKNLNKKINLIKIKKINCNKNRCLVYLKK